jgi:hypothetical protein
MKKLFIPALCVGFVTTISMLEAGIAAVPQAQSVAPETNVAKKVEGDTHAQAPKIEVPVVPATPAPTSVDQTSVEQKTEVAHQEDIKESTQDEEFSEEEFRKQIAELEKLFAEEEKKENKVEDKASEPKEVAAIK